jgi:hypothetical protein
MDSSPTSAFLEAEAWMSARRLYFTRDWVRVYLACQGIPYILLVLPQKESDLTDLIV